MLRILIVEDHQVLAKGLERYLDLHFSEMKIDVSSTGKECLATMSQNNFDLVLLDINLPDINGKDLCQFIITANPSTKIIALTGMMEKGGVRKMMDAGASGYILKTAIADELIEGIECVMRGEVFVSRELG